MNKDSYYGDEDLAAKRRQQAVQSALVGDQNESTPAPQQQAASDPNSPESLQAINLSLGFGDFNPQTGLNADGSTVVGPNGDPSHHTPVPPTPPKPPVPPVSPTTPNGGIPAPQPTATAAGQQVSPVPGSEEWRNWVNSFLSQAPHFGAMQLPTTPLPTYQPQQLLTPEAMDAEKLQFALLQRVLQAPDQYSEQNIRQMQEAQKEQALASQQGALQKLQDRYAGMGRTGSGRLDANARRMQDDTTSQILQGNRDIDLQASTANVNSRSSALQNANNVLGEAVSRRQSQANQDYLGYNSEKDKVNFALQQALGQSGVNTQANAQNLQSQGLALQSALGTGGLSLDWYKSLTANDNFMQQLLANLGMFNANQTNSTLR